MNERYLIVLRRDQLPMLSDALYEGVEQADSDGESGCKADMLAFRDEMQAELHRGVARIADVRTVLDFLALCADGFPLPDDVREAGNRLSPLLGES